MKDLLKSLILEALKELSIEDKGFVVEHPTDLRMGDYSTNVAIKNNLRKQEIFEYLKSHRPDEVERVEMVGPGFINFYLSKQFFAESLKQIIKAGDKFGRTKKFKGEKVMVEYTDPNPFKAFHIGHLMSNAIGEAVSRVIEWNGADVRRANYQGDTGMHIAMAVWGYFHGEWSTAYAIGAKAYVDNLEARKEIEEINKKIFDRSDKSITKIYDEGRKASLEYFESIYKKLGTKFDYYFFESEAGELGKKLVEKNVGKIFEESDGAIVFHGEKFDPSLHTRVFVNRQKLPTYEAKDLGNAVNKYKKYKYTKSVVITGNEIKEYFKVMLTALSQLYPDLSKSTKHLPHGMLRLPTGKMSSRTGDVITAEDLIKDVSTKVKDSEPLSIAAIKYMILRQSIGNDIVFDFDKSVSTEGDSGVYLEYAHARATSVLDKASTSWSIKVERAETHEIERLLYRLPEVVERAGEDYSPQFVTTYLTELASSFNNFYAHEQVNSDSLETPYRLAIVEAFKVVMKNGLTILGIPVLDRV